MWPWTPYKLHFHPPRVQLTLSLRYCLVCGNRFITITESKISDGVTAHLAFWFTSSCLVTATQKWNVSFFYILKYTHRHIHWCWGDSVLSFWLVIVTSTSLLHGFYNSFLYLLHCCLIGLTIISFHLSVFSLLHPSLLRWVARSARTWEKEIFSDTNLVIGGQQI